MKRVEGFQNQDPAKVMFVLVVSFAKRKEELQYSLQVFLYTMEMRDVLGSVETGGAAGYKTPGGSSVV